MGPITRTRAASIREFILSNIENHPKDIVAHAEKHFQVTRTTIHRHLNTLVKEEKIAKFGTTFNTTYSLLSSLNKNLVFSLTPELSEHAVWDKHFGPLKERLPENIYDICFHGFTEMLNNSIDHSRGNNVSITTQGENGRFVITIVDDGMGAFKKIKEAKLLKDEREAVLEISKGKVTTDPSKHSGEGIFFTSRMFDVYTLLANGLCYIKDNMKDDWFLESRAQRESTGTIVKMEISLTAKQTSKEVFKKHSDLETQAFDKTHILVNLSQSTEDRFVSRSQAKRILSNLEKFNHVILDFRNVASVGQAFVDEVFRVFQKQSPHVQIDVMNANEDIKFMIERGKATARM